MGGVFFGFLPSLLRWNNARRATGVIRFSVSRRRYAAIFAQMSILVATAHSVRSHDGACEWDAITENPSMRWMAAWLKRRCARASEPDDARCSNRSNRRGGYSVREAGEERLLRVLEAVDRIRDRIERNEITEERILEDRDVQRVLSMPLAKTGWSRGGEAQTRLEAKAHLGLLYCGRPMLPMGP